MRNFSSISALFVACLSVCVGTACFDAGSPADGSEDSGAVADAAPGEDSGGSGDPSDAVDSRDARSEAAADADVGCGECSAPEGTDHVVAECESGSCELRCEAGWVDTDEDFRNDCELECEETNGGTEICDGEDNDCDGEVDEEFMTGECTVGTGACETSGMYECVSDTEAECDAEAGQPSDETCGDDVDNDCDGDTDESDAVDAQTWYADSDGDGFGDPNDSKQACEKPEDYVSNSDDCDDSDSAVKPRDFFVDADGDGFTTSMTETKCSDSSPPSGYASSKSSDLDCDDGDADVNPGQAEKCDGKDTNCDGTKDNISQSSSKGTEFYIDCDGDGFAPGTTGSVRACSEPSNPPSGCSSSNADWTDQAPTGDKTDCNDDAPKAYPGQTDWFDSETQNASGDRLDKWDYDCNGQVDERYDGTNCETNTGSGCDNGFKDPVSVDCGQKGDYYGCVPGCCDSNGFNCTCVVCSSSSEKRTQQCR